MKRVLTSLIVLTLTASLGCKSQASVTQTVGAQTNLSATSPEPSMLASSALTASAGEKLALTPRKDTEPKPDSIIDVAGYREPFLDGSRTVFVRFAGFTHDGKEFGFCQPAANVTECVFQDASGVKRSWSSVTNLDAAARWEPKPASTARAAFPAAVAPKNEPSEDPKKLAEIVAFAKNEGLWENHAQLPPYLKGAFPFDFKLSVRQVPHRCAESCASSADLPRVELLGERPNFDSAIALAMRAPARPQSGPNDLLLHEYTTFEALFLSPDGKELGAIAHSSCGAQCATVDIVRVPLGRIAARVYNAWGQRARDHRKVSDAIAMFEKARAADPKERGPAYNLAKLYAQTQDPKTESALQTALALDPSLAAEVKQNELFALYTKVAWFRALDARAQSPEK